ncbi:MAG: hypothetical protein H6833_07095 [Planctomycetes bacterium]|nr:hypothetical protein [Planctomycetota bacterium]
MRTRCFPWIGLVLLSCGPSNQDVFDEYRGRFEDMRAKWKRIHDHLPAAGRTSPANLIKVTPKPTFHEDGDGNDTEIVMLEQLVDPDARLAFDLRLSDDLLRGMNWTGPENPMAESVRGERAGDSLRDELEHALATRYLVVVRVLQHDPPRTVSEGRFTRGSIAFEALLIDLAAEKVLGAVACSATNAERVEYMVREGSDSRERRLEDFAASDLWERAREDLCTKLGQATGGEFVLR